MRAPTPMRFCPFCAAENADDATHCSACAKKLPPWAKRGGTKDEPAGETLKTVPPPPPAAPVIDEQRATGNRQPATGNRQPEEEKAEEKEEAKAVEATPTPLPAAREPTPTVAMEPQAIAEGPPALAPMPEPPDAGPVAAARYFVQVVKARHQRTGRMRLLGEEIQADVGLLDGVLRSLGQTARKLALESRALDDENRAIDAAEARRDEASKQGAAVARRIEEEQARFETVALELGDKLAAAEKASAAAAEEVARLTRLLRETREKKKELERRQRDYLKSAEQREKQASNEALGERRTALRRSAEDLRADAARLEPERSDLERAVATLDEDVGQASARAEAARADLDAARKALEDARAGHRHRRGELDAEAAQRARAAADASAEIGRRLVTLGTLLNLNRIPGPEVDPIYTRVDALKNAIAGRETQIERLRAESERVDKAAALRGAGVLAGAVALVVAVICVIIVLL